MFYSLLHNSIPRDEAYDFLENYYAWRSEKAAHSIRKLLRIPGLYVFVPRMFRRMTQRQFGASAGFECNYVSVRRDNVEFDILSCPYFDICSKYGCPELTRIFCLADDICYSDMHPKLEFRRSKTLGRDDECCDFKITIR